MRRVQFRTRCPQIARASSTMSVCSYAVERNNIRKLTPLSPVQFSPPRLRPQPSPLLEEEGDVACGALVADRTHPICAHRTRTRSAFAADDHPIDPVEIDLPHRTDQRFD